MATLKAAEGVISSASFATWRESSLAVLLVVNLVIQFIEAPRINMAVLIESQVSVSESNIAVA